MILTAKVNHGGDQPAGRQAQRTVASLRALMQQTDEQGVPTCRQCQIYLAGNDPEP